MPTGGHTLSVGDTLPAPTTGSDNQHNAHQVQPDYKIDMPGSTIYGNVSSAGVGEFGVEIGSLADVPEPQRFLDPNTGTVGFDFGAIGNLEASVGIDLLPAESNLLSEVPQPGFAAGDDINGAESSGLEINWDYLEDLPNSVGETQGFNFAPLHLQGLLTEEAYNELLQAREREAVWNAVVRSPLRRWEPPKDSSRLRVQEEAQLGTALSLLDEVSNGLYDVLSQFDGDISHFYWDSVDVGVNFQLDAVAFQVGPRAYERFRWDENAQEYHFSELREEVNLGGKVYRQLKMSLKLRREFHDAGVSYYVAADAGGSIAGFGTSAGVGTHLEDWNPDRWKRCGKKYAQSALLRFAAEVERVLLWESEGRFSLKFTQRLLGGSTAAVNVNFRIGALGERQLQIEVMTSRGLYVRGVVQVRREWHDYPDFIWKFTRG